MLYIWVLFFLLFFFTYVIEKLSVKFANKDFFLEIGFQNIILQNKIFKVWLYFVSLIITEIIRIKRLFRFFDHDILRFSNHTFSLFCCWSFFICSLHSISLFYSKTSRRLNFPDVFFFMLNESSMVIFRFITFVI